MNAAACPCCGTPVIGAAPIDALCRNLPPVLSLVVRAMAERPRARLDANALAAIVYAGAPDGGPMDGADAIRCAVRRGRSLLPPMGWEIGTGGRGDRKGYYLRAISREADERSSALQHGVS